MPFNCIHVEFRLYECVYSYSVWGGFFDYPLSQNVKKNMLQVYLQRHSLRHQYQHYVTYFYLSLSSSRNDVGIARYKYRQYR